MCYNDLKPDTNCDYEGLKGQYWGKRRKTMEIKAKK